MNVRCTLAGVAALTALFFVLGSAPPAAAEPATTPVFPGGSSATRLSGYAFDTCEAPTVTTMQAWTTSPYRGVGVYIGGPNRTCPQHNLNRSWVLQVSTQRWRVIPIYMGRQAPCTFRANAVEFTSSTAASTGTKDAANAVAAAKALGMLPGSAIYGDMEHYLATDSTCRSAVLRYLSSWTKELHRQGYLAGVYAHLYSGAKHLSEVFGSTSYARPDAIWIARWDNRTALTGWEGISNTQWANRQRGKQYQGDHNETHGGVQINIDSDRFDAPVATVTYAYRATADVSARRGPKLANSVAKTYSAGATLQVVCQTRGSMVRTTSVWDRLTDGTYVTDYKVSTTSNTTYTAPLPRCTYPYHVTTSSLNERLGPSASSTIKATLPAGALGWVYCQVSGSTVGTTSVWDRFENGYYATDYYLATPSNTTFSKPIAKC